MSPEAKALRKFFYTLRAYKVHNWSSGSSADAGTDQSADRSPAGLGGADVVSSRMRVDVGQDLHQVVLDIDHEAWLVKSSTPGHYHLYINVPGGIEWSKYKVMMQAMQYAGVLEPGYVKASINRGFSSLRLPWIKKDRAPVFAGAVSGRVIGARVITPAPAQAPAQSADDDLFNGWGWDDL